MRYYNMPKFLLSFLLVFFVSCFFEPKVVMVTYNVQNLFDDQDQGSEYSDFRGLSTELYEQKISNLAGGFERIRQKYGNPAIVLLQEVENSIVVQELVSRTKSLENMHVIFAKEPSHATGLAILSRYEVIETLTVQVRDPLDEKKVLRPILIAIIRISNNQVLAIMNIHLQSQTQERNIYRRSATFEQLHLAIEAIRRKYNHNIAVIIGGDFNIDLGQEAMITSSIIPIEYQWETMRSGYFYNDWISYRAWAKERDYLVGSYAYQGNWQALDGFLIDYKLLLGNGLTFTKQEPMSHHYFLENRIDQESEEVYLYPKAFYRNRIDGVSDHLPVIALFKYHKIKEREE